MAKNPKKAKKAKKAKSSRAKAAAVTPTYLGRGESFNMGLHDVVRALKVIEKHGRTTKFARGAKAAGVIVNVPADTVNFVKDFMVANRMHNDPVGKHIVNAQVAVAQGAAAGAPQDRFKGCDFGDGG
jgi:hypothetical protein